jgi:hypothetical protein
MTDILTQRLVLSDNVMSSPVGDETVILHLDTGSYLGLDSVGTRVWTLLNRGLTPAAICVELINEYDVERVNLEADVRRLLEELKANKVLRECGHD